MWNIVRRISEVGTAGPSRPRTPREGVGPAESHIADGAAFRDIARRVNFLSFDQLVKDYEYALATGDAEFRL